MPDKFEGIRTQLFGVEVEMTGLTRRDAADIAAEVLNGTATSRNTRKPSYYVRDGQDRRWKFVYDGSIKRKRPDGRSASQDYAVEMVTPILKYDDIPVLQEIVHKLHDAGAICNDSTGIHIHVNAAPFDAQKLRNLVNIFASREEMLFKALGVAQGRAQQYCKRVDPAFLERLNAKKPKTMEQLKHLWYNDTLEDHPHYHSTRYHALNLHPVFTDNNFEVRAFNAVLDAEILRAYIVLVLAVSNQALTQKTATPKPLVSDNPRYTFRCWLIRMGLNGEEFQNVRRILLERMEGTIAWRHPEQLAAAREKLRRERRVLREHSDSLVWGGAYPTRETTHENHWALVSDSELDFDEEDAQMFVHPL